MADTMNLSDVKSDTPDQSDLEGDSFEDAQDAVDQAPRMNRQSSTASTRSLTGGSSARGSPLRDSTSSNRNSQSPPGSAGTPRSAPEENDSDDAKESKAPKSVAERVAALQKQKAKQATKPSTPPGKRPQSSSKKPLELPVRPTKPTEPETSDPSERTPRPTDISQRTPKSATEYPTVTDQLLAKAHSMETESDQPMVTDQLLAKHLANEDQAAVAKPAAESSKHSEEKEDSKHTRYSEHTENTKHAEHTEHTDHSEPTEHSESQEEESEPEPEATEEVPLQTPKPPKRSSTTFQEVELSSTANHEGIEQHTESHEDRGRQMSADSPRSPQSTSSASHSRSTSRVPSISEKATGLTSAATFGFGSWGSSKASSSHTSGKKMSGPWGWLSRKKTAPDPSPPPPQPALPRQNSTTSNASSKPDLKLNKIDHEPVPAKDQLKERFKLARMKEQAGINADQITTPRSSVNSAVDGAHESGSNRVSDPSGGVHSPISTASISEAASSPIEPPKRGHKARAPSLAQSISVDPNLAPGTVSGINHGPSTMADPEAPVDWDLWQSVVYEGPAAVVKSSPADLSRSIASGIPNPIRGVVWQVLAESKNEELEKKYHELVARGTDKEIVTSPTAGPLSAKSMASNEPSKESVASSASSTHSDIDGVASPAASAHLEAEGNPAKAQADREKKKKEEQATIKKLEKTIRKDLGARSNYSKYFAAKEMQDDLFGVCKAYALYDEQVGYAQGMNFIVMPLLFNMPAEEAFCLLVSLMNHYKLRDTFTPEMPGLHKQLFQFERVLEETNMKLCRHLSRRSIAPSLYATQWFITLFAYKFPLQLVVRVYDLVLSEGLQSAILKFGIALMQKNAEKLLAIQDMAALKTFLNERLFDAYIDSSPSSHSILEQGFFGSSGGSEKDVYRADLLVRDACAVEISNETLQTYADEYESKTKLEKDRQTELDELRATTNAQAIKIRSLEERVEKSDTEHVQITQEMIKSRMENEDLRTTGHEQQAELEKVKKELENAPEQVETSLKEEMERIMARNTEVQSQNRVLEEQMAEMEKDLVQTKMEFAQVNGDYETLKQKWSDLRRALGD